MAGNLGREVITSFKIIFLLMFLFSCSEEENKPLINTGTSEFPAFECEDLNGNKEIIKSKKGQILVLNYWSYGCVPCVKEIPGFNKLSEKYRDNRVRFVAISPSPVEKTNKFLEKNEFKFEQKRLTVNTLNFRAAPRTLICDQNGIVQYDILGGSENTYKYVDNILTTLLNGGILVY